MSPLKNLADLLSSASGRRLLSEHNIHVSCDEFLTTLKTPKDSAPHMLGRRSGALPVYVHQQPSPDFSQSVVAKFRLLNNLRLMGGDHVEPWYVAIDTDRAASSKSPTRIAWHRAGRTEHTFRLTSPHSKYLEFRNIPVDLDRLRDSWQRIHTQVHRGCPPEMEQRLEEVGPHFFPARTTSYGEFSAGLGCFLLKRTLGETTNLLTLSNLQKLPAVTNSICRLLSRRQSFISAYNRKLAVLQSLGFDPGLRLLPPDYLPFFYSCPVDGERMRLSVQRTGLSWAAQGTSRAGRTYRFSLDDGSNINTLMETGRVSLDITLPVHLSSLFSGLVVGKSSALYCMIMKSAAEESLDEQLCPMIIPTALTEKHVDPRNLFQYWLQGGIK
jgi:hypothetical protein